MKIFIVLTVLVSAAVAADQVCFKGVETFCKEGDHDDLPACKSIIPQFMHSVGNLTDFANRQLEISYKYMLLATQFNSYVKNRPGFFAKFMALSDRSWEKGIEMIKYLTKRGGKMNFADRGELKNSAFDVTELEAMATVLDTEKNLFERARQTHQRASHPHYPHNYDPEVAHYMEEEYLSDLAGTVRKFAGYANDLKNLYFGSKDVNLDNYLFDQYLQKA